MNLRWLFWTGLLAIIVFFGAIYFGIKYNWVNGSEPSSANNRPTKSLNQKQKAAIKQVKSKAPEIKQSTYDAPGNGINPELIDEIDTTEEPVMLGSSDLSIEEVVSQCQSLSQSIGIPELQLDQAISECVDRNSGHLTTEDDSADEREMLIREQCNIAITQKDLLSLEEIKMLVDECVASMS